MKSSLKSTLKNFSFSIGSNLITLIVSTLMVAIVPKIIGVTEYGYWQLYVFYVSYLGFFQIGWSDGVYLRYGGSYYNQLDRKKLGTQFWLLTVFEITICIVLYIILFNVFPRNDKFVIMAICIFLIVIIIPKAYLTYILQITSRIKEYSLITISESLIYLIITSFILIKGVDNYLPIIIADIIGKVFSLILSVIFCYDLVFTKLEHFNQAIKEAIANISVGCKLMIANIAGMLMLGIVKLAIENFWDIETFGKISLSISISNMLMVFINAIGIVLFPILRRLNETKRNELYPQLRTGLIIPLFLMLSLYFPINYIMSLWLPQYSESLHYMAILFPLCIFECKMSLLVNTYLKTIRKEKAILRINVCSVILSCILTFTCVFIMHNMILTVFTILIVFSFRCSIAEIILSKYIHLNIIKDLIIEIIICGAFIISSWVLGGLIGFLIYFFIYLLFLINKKSDIIKLYNKIKFL